MLGTTNLSMKYEVITVFLDLPWNTKKKNVCCCFLLFFSNWEDFLKFSNSEKTFIQSSYQYLVTKSPKWCKQLSIHPVSLYL